MYSLPGVDDIVPEIPAIVLDGIPSEDELKHYHPFTVSLQNGFLPLLPPPASLPPAFKKLHSLLERTPMKTLADIEDPEDKSTGLLATFTLGETVHDDETLPDLTDEIDKVENDLRVVSALYRDYCFLSSAYLLEPCHQEFWVEDQERKAEEKEAKEKRKREGEGEEEREAEEKGRRNGVRENGTKKEAEKTKIEKNQDTFFQMERAKKKQAEKSATGVYGLARSSLPEKLAKPLVRVAKMLGFKPFMEYAGSYALFNWRMENPDLGMDYDNLRLVRAFEHGLNPKSSEAGFILTHIAMVNHSAQLVRGAVHAFAACKDKEGARFRSSFGRDEEVLDEDSDKLCAQAARKSLQSALQELVKALAKVNEEMNKMWWKSKPSDYIYFRTFIFGITAQDMFPNGVIYEGVSEEPMYFRGESGANDSMIPMCDNFFEIAMPKNPMTEIYSDFRFYRPTNHLAFLEWVKDEAQKMGTAEWVMSDAKSALIYLHGINEVRNFRWRHWCFCKEYILKNTKHPTATGGSPIIDWLPNQLEGTYARMEEVAKAVGTAKECEDMMERMRAQRQQLRAEVQKFRDDIEKPK